MQPNPRRVDEDEAIAGIETRVVAAVDVILSAHGGFNPLDTSGRDELR